MNWVTSKVRNGQKQLQLLFTTEGTEFTENSLKYTLSAGSWFFSHPLRETQPEIASDPASMILPQPINAFNPYADGYLKVISGSAFTSRLLAGPGLPALADWSHHHSSVLEEPENE